MCLVGRDGREIPGRELSWNCAEHWRRHQPFQRGILHASFIPLDACQLCLRGEDHIPVVGFRTRQHSMNSVTSSSAIEGRLVDSDLTPRNIREVEAESLALICCEALQLPGVEYARGYIQNWLSGEMISDRSAQKIFSPPLAGSQGDRGTG